MKFMITWTERNNGSVAEVEAGAKRGLQLFSKWSPPPGLNILQFVARVDGRGGYVLAEADDAAVLAEGPSKFGVLNDFEITPVLDITEGVPIVQEGIDFRDSIS